MTTRQKFSPCPRSPGAWAFFCARRDVRLFVALLGPLIGISLTGGCTRDDTRELPLYAQIAEIDRGARHTILVERVALGDVDLIPLANVNGLEDLLCDNPDSQFTASGLTHLRELRTLRHLRIRGHGIDDAALAEIAKIMPLRILNLPNAEITDAGLAQLAELPNLEQLRIGGPNISPAGIEALAALRGLKRLHTIDIPVSDDGLRLLAGMKQLESLYIDGGNFSDAAADEIFRTRPDLHVHFDQEHHDRDPHRHSHP